MPKPLPEFQNTLSTKFRNIVTGGSLMSLCLSATAMNAQNGMAVSNTNAASGLWCITSPEPREVKVRVNGELKTIRSKSDSLGQQ
jgi:phage protein U